jgi:hypothetical protein
MRDYRFYTDILRFVGSRADRSDAAVAAMTERLAVYAAEMDATGGRFTVPAPELPQAARAFAGVAGILQKLLLPEAVAAGHADVERRIRWSVDASMDLVRVLLVHAAEGTAGDVTVELPPLP